MQGETPHKNHSPDASTDAANALGGLTLTLPVVFFLGLITGIVVALKAGMKPIELLFGANLLVPGLITAIVATLFYPVGYLLLRFTKISIGWSMFFGGGLALVVGCFAVFVVFAYF